MPQSRLRRSCLVAVASAAALIAGAPSALAAEISATPSTLSSAFASASAGDTILLSSGSYGTFGGGMKSGEVTLRPAEGASVTMALRFYPAANITIDGVQNITSAHLEGGQTKNITVRNSTFSGQTTMRTGSLANANILFDRNAHLAWDKCDGCGEGRVWLPQRTSQPSGITIQNSRFGPGGDSDGIQNGSNGTRILNNEFVGLKQLSGGRAHVDSIQLYGSQNTVIAGNYFHDDSVHIMAPDGGNHETIIDNVFVATSAYRPTIQLGSHDGTRFEHNTVRNASVHMDSKGGNEPSTGGILRDNVMVNSSFNLTNGSGCSGCTVSNNLMSGAVFTGGANPTSYAAHKLAPGSPGIGAATDGTDQGARIAPAPVPAGSGSPGSPAAPAQPAARPRVRLLTGRRAMRRRGRLRLRVISPAAGTVALTSAIRPRGRSKGRPIKLRKVVLRFSASGRRTVKLRLSGDARRRLARWRRPRLVVRTFGDRGLQRPIRRHVIAIRR